MAKLLTQFDLQSLKPRDKDYKRADNGGLFVEVLTSGTMVWRYQYLLNGKREKVTIGPYRQAGSAKSRVVISLERARDIHNEYRRLVQNGESPAKRLRSEKIASKNQLARAATFADLADRWFQADVAHKSHAWSYTVGNWLKRDILPALGKMDPQQIDEYQVRKVIESVEGRGALASAAKVRAICKHIFAFAKRKREIDANPMLEIEAVGQRRTSNHRALSIREIGPFLNALEQDSGREANKLATRLLALTLTRKDELRLAKWNEFDWELGVWTIPAHRMKMQVEHKIFLSRQALACLNRLNELACRSDYILPNFSTLSRPIGHTTINSVIDRLEITGARFVPHGLRATASTVLNESGQFRPDVIERALAHRHHNKVRATYNQAEYSSERAMMLQWWADYLDLLESGEVVAPSSFKGMMLVPFS